jgi:PTH2 family peptidyl-tRNA hydrolase
MEDDLMYESKQMIIMRRDLKMRKGKIAAQASHASVEAVLMALKKENRFNQLINDDDYMTIESEDMTPLTQWFKKGVAKVCVYVDSEEELLALHHKAKELGFISSLIQDAGYTEFHGEPTYTCMALEPLYIEDANKITGDLPLY